MSKNAKVSEDVVKALVEIHRGFLRYLTPKVESPAIAEEILQNAFVKTLEKGSELRDGESAVAWFYRLLRNSLIDHYRHRDVERRGLSKEARESAPLAEALDDLAKATICGCLRLILPDLKPEYAQALNVVDLDERSITEYAAEAGITVNNANVRLHRARVALKSRLEVSCGTCATHGCLDCSCHR